MSNFGKVREVMDKLLQGVPRKRLCILTRGPAYGADEHGQNYAYKKRCKVMVFYPDTGKDMNRASLKLLYARDVEMVNAADALVLFSVKGLVDDMRLLKMAKFAGLKTKFVELR